MKVGKLGFYDLIHRNKWTASMQPMGCEAQLPWKCLFVSTFEWFGPVK